MNTERVIARLLLDEYGTGYSQTLLFGNLSKDAIG